LKLQIQFSIFICTNMCGKRILLVIVLVLAMDGWKVANGQTPTPVAPTSSPGGGANSDHQFQVD
jgi:hypothetical protein